MTTGIFYAVFVERDVCVEFAT